MGQVVPIQEEVQHDSVPPPTASTRRTATPDESRVQQQRGIESIDVRPDKGLGVLRFRGAGRYLLPVLATSYLRVGTHEEGRLCERLAQRWFRVVVLELGSRQDVVDIEFRSRHIVVHTIADWKSTCDTFRQHGVALRGQVLIFCEFQHGAHTHPNVLNKSEDALLLDE